MLLASGCSEPGKQDQVVAPIAEYRISERPLVSIGVVKGEDAYQLFRVRSAVQLQSGVIVVANNGTSELRYYDAQGRHLRTVGRPGDGPGEFRELWYARAIRGDTVVTWDVGQRRVSYFDSNGDLAHSFTADLSEHQVHVGEHSIPAYPIEMVATWDGLLLFHAAAPSSVLSGLRSDGTHDPGAVADDGVYRLDYSLFSVDRTGSVVRAFGPVPAVEWFMSGGIRQFRFMGHWFYMAGGRQQFVIGSGKPYSYQVTSGSDGLRRVDTNIPARAISDEIWSRRIQRALPESPSRDRIARLEAMPKPDTMPSYSALLLDDEDRVWIQEYDPDRSAIQYTVGVASDRSPEPAPAQRWSVFELDGRQVGRLELPANVRIMDISRGRVIAVAEDEFRVERVQVFSLERVPQMSNGQ